MQQLGVGRLEGDKPVGSRGMKSARKAKEEKEEEREEE